MMTIKEIDENETSFLRFMVICCETGEKVIDVNNNKSDQIIVLGMLC